MQNQNRKHQNLRRSQMEYIMDFLSYSNPADLSKYKGPVEMTIYRYFFAVLLLTGLTAPGCSTVPWTRHVRLECGSCHDGKPMKGSPALKNEKNPSETCKRCHNYLKDDDHHPSDPDFELIGEKCAVVDPIFPLVSGKMECLTCHQMHAEEVSYSGTRHFLRGGPYSDRRTVCFKCSLSSSFRILRIVLWA